MRTIMVNNVVIVLTYATVLTLYKFHSKCFNLRKLLQITCIRLTYCEVELTDTCQATRNVCS